MATFELSGIVRNFGGVRALKGVDIAVDAGESLVLLGENGAGKSTLIKILTGALAPDAGEIRIDGVAQDFRSPLDAQNAGISAVYQEPMIYPHLSVLENLFMGREITGAFGRVDRAAMRRTARPILAELELDETILDRPMAALSLGYQQLVLIAQTLAQNARLIIFDEPTSILSRAETERLFTIIDRLRAGGRAIVYITHRLEEVPRVGDRVTVLTDGAVTGGYGKGGFSETTLLELMAGKNSREIEAEITAHRTPAGDPATPPVMEIAGLSHPAHFEDVNLRLPPGMITGIYGLVGSGRSEVALTIFGELTRSAGTIRLEGQEIAPADPAEAIALGIGYLPEDRKLQGIFASKPLEANMTSNGLARFRGGWGLLDFPALAAEARRIMGQYNIKAQSARTLISTLSGGNQQKGLFARWAGQPFKVLILDEPTRGIDVRTKDEIHDFIRDLATGGVAVVVISSDLKEVLSVSDRIVVMRAGRVVDEVSGTAMTPERVLSAAIGAGQTGESAA
ncbi:sugar ABC transporter ATP-binding protein [Acidimangrovimonas sediminis]|uniref:sugar ABC transporter ATP-binding protein n=1 Tax=Acidimangrovimonas sediminis TaxID=2056283 RepID=UPI000C80FFA9|nr:sugar ABC transporter ATP-binding protein [Acidimangrovimonas sediminis]